MTAIDDNEITSLLAPLKGTGKVALAVSGGSDSMALLVLVGRARPGWGKRPEIVVLTVNHGLREAAELETKLVARTANNFGFPCRILGADRTLTGGNIQARAREMRYSLLSKACHELGADMLVTAHHLEDQAETFLLRLARGSGVDGLAAMASSSHLQGIRLVRPLLGVSKVRLLDYLEFTGHSGGWIEDPSNRDMAFDRVKIRNLAPQLAALGLTPARLAETARLMSDAANVLEASADDLAAKAVEISPAGYCRIERATFLTGLPDTRLRLLARCLTAIGGKVYRPRMTRLRDLMDSIITGVACRRTLSGCRIAIFDDRIDIWREIGRTELAVLVLDPGDTKIWDGRFRVSVGRATDQPVTVKALGGDGWRLAKEVNRSWPRGFAPVARTMVSFWSDDELLAVPHLDGYPKRCGIEANFVAGAQINPDFGPEMAN